MRGFRGALRVSNFFVAILCARNCIPTIKLLAMSKTAKLEFFYEFRRRLGWLNVFRGIYIVGNFFITSLCVSNGISTIKLLVIPKRRN